VSIEFAVLDETAFNYEFVQEIEENKKNIGILSLVIAFCTLRDDRKFIL
jgi:hypothetical protein